jgi:hypothetical protein
MKEMQHLAMPTEQPLRDGLSPEEYGQLFELLKKARALVCRGNPDRLAFRTSKGPTRKLGGADFDGLSDLGMSKRRNLNPQLAGLRPNPKGTPRTAKHRF